jgi:hypothetical protein
MYNNELAIQAVEETVYKKLAVNDNEGDPEFAKAEESLLQENRLATLIHTTSAMAGIALTTCGAEPEKGLAACDLMLGKLFHLAFYSGIQYAGRLAREGEEIASLAV